MQLIGAKKSESKIKSADAKENGFQKLVIWCFASPVFAALVTFVSFFAALLGSLYATEIKQALPSWLKAGPLNQPVTWFWCIATVAVLLFWSSQHGSNTERSKAQNQLIDKTEDLEKLLRTLPPTDFLETFQETYDSTYRAFADAMLNASEGEDAPAIDEVIRSVLYFALVMLKKFEANPKAPAYSANFMLYRPIESLNEAERNDLKERLKFIPKETDVAQLKGILDLVLELSTTSQRQANLGGLGKSSVSADSLLIPFALPLPQSHQTPDKTLWRVLPGAPMAFCTKEIQGCFETKELMEWCNKFGDFSPSVVAAQEEYFKSEVGQNIRSFVSIPLIVSKQVEPLGVLNIHSNCPDLLATREPDRHLWPMFSPYKNMLADLIYKWKVDSLH